MVDATLDGVMYIAQSYISWSEGLVKNREYVVQVQVLLLAQVVREDEHDDVFYKYTSERRRDAKPYDSDWKDKEALAGVWSSILHFATTTREGIFINIYAYRFGTSEPDEGMDWVGQA